MNRKVLIFICLVSFLPFACKKERKYSGPTLINGKAIDITTGSSFNGIKIVLYEAGHTSKTPLDSMYTGSDGSFLFNFEAEKGKSYQLFAYGDEIIDYVFNSRYRFKPGLLLFFLT